ncbi:MAG: alpha/beta hydrolase [Deltaproteobacteria bacterium]|nr:alpha/beta hydrolase [Deltaproteobacteria bacterium]
MKLFITLLIIVGALVLIIIILPQLTSKETCTHEEAVQKFAKGKFVTVDGKNVHYVEAGNGPPIILIHGFLYHTVMWKKNIDALAEKFKVYAIDLWGWGYSERLGEKEYSFERYGKQIVGFMDALNIKKATLVGQSMGGGISVYVAAYHSERVDRLILVDPTVIPQPMTTIGKIYQSPFIGEFMNAIPGDALEKNNIRTIWFYDKTKATDEYCKEVLQPLCIKGSYAGFMFILRNVLKEPYVEKEANLLAKMSIPTLIIHGREDKAVPLDRSQKLNGLWKGSKLVIFEKAGHTPHEEYPEKFNKLAIDFLS